MSNQNEDRLRETLEEHRRLLHDEQLATDAVAAKDHDFMQQYVVHRNGVIAPTLHKLQKLVREYGHDLVIDDSVGNENPAFAEGGPIQATLVLEGYDLTYKSASPQLAFAANCASRTIAVYASIACPTRTARQASRAPEPWRTYLPIRSKRCFSRSSNARSPTRVKCTEAHASGSVART